MRKRKRAIIVSAALAAAPVWASAAVNVAFNYDPTVTIASNSAFTMNVSTVPIVGDTIIVPPGDYFEFNVNTLVTGDTNPASGGAYDQANGTTQPPLLGLTGFGFAFTNNNTSVVAPVVTAGKSTLAVPLGGPPLRYDVSGKGTANAASGEAGTAGAPLSAGYLPEDTTATTGFYRLTLGAGTAQDIFTGLKYQALTSGSSLIANVIPTGAVAYANLRSAGNASTFPVYQGDVVGLQPGDTLTPLPSLTVLVPEPASTATLLIGATSLLVRRRNRTLITTQ
jgi:hypothetical protein